MAAVAGRAAHVYVASLEFGVGLAHYHSVKSAHGATWRIVTVDPNFGERTQFAEYENTLDFLWDTVITYAKLVRNFILVCPVATSERKRSFAEEEK